MYTPFGIFLRTLRLEYQELLKHMAEKLDMTSSYLSAIECGKREIPENLPHKIIEVYDMCEHEKDKMFKAIDESSKQIKISLEDVSLFKKKLALEFARKFDELEEDEAKKVMHMLTKKRR